MAVYAIGDLQGCREPLERLLEHVRFDPPRDQLWFLGDLVNRGPDSLGTLRLVRGLGDAATTVLGNHDLHLLAVAYAGWPTRAKDTLDDVLTAPDRDELLAWLCNQPLLHHDRALDWCMVHAGIPHIWSLDEALARAAEVESVLRSDAAVAFLRALYGNEPAGWDPALQGLPRLRVIVNYFTRMRLINAAGKLELAHKRGLDTAPSGYHPWFRHRPPAHGSSQLVFGHWAALEGVAGVPGVHALDTGCVWGRCLTALRLEDEQRFSAGC